MDIALLNKFPLEQIKVAGGKAGALGEVATVTHEKSKITFTAEGPSKSSRICVKNLPKYIKEDYLREFFSQKGEVTDAKIIRTKDGKNRQFAFIGFRTESEAEDALKYFNNSYMDTCKITCEVARRVGDPNLPRPWSHYSAKKVNIVERDKDKAIIIESPTNVKGSGSSSGIANNSAQRENVVPQLQDFLQVMQPRVKSKLWADDTLGASHLDPDSNAEENEVKLPKIKKKQSAQAKVKSTSSLEQREYPETSLMELLDEDDFMTDADYFNSRVKRNWSDSDSDDHIPETDKENSVRELPELDAKGQTVELQVPLRSANGHVEEVINPSECLNYENNDDENPISSFDKNKQAVEASRLFIRNLPYTATEVDIVELFSQFGDVPQVHLVIDKDTKRSKGIGYVLYAFPESAVRALEELDNSIFQGRLLHVMPAKPQSSNIENIEYKNDTFKEKKTFKQLREEQRKASEASGNTKAWNTLFMRQDTVIENIARKHGIDKSDLLEREAEDLAVRIALGETRVVAETKKALSNAGVNIVALEEYASKKTDNAKRSNHVILVKNLPYRCSEGDLANMFGKFGNLDKIILPPTRILALVIFLEAAEARAAFKGLAYKRYKDAPLYLEWAPGNILSPNPVPAAEEQKNVIGEEKVRKVLFEQSVEGIPEEEIDPDRMESRSVFVKNLNFKSTDESLKKHFSDKMKTGTIKSAKVQRQLKKGKNVSLGFGFIEFDSVETAASICKDLQGTILDGHALILQLCHSKKTGEAVKKDEKNKSSTKLLVKNVAFEATEKDLRQLFSPFGQIRSLRLPMKIGGHRGFAFVEYVTKQEAQNALQALSSTHLYGRHLVIERAKHEETLDELRERTAAQFVDELNGFQKLSKKRKHTAILDEGTVKFSKIVDQFFK